MEKVPQFPSVPLNIAILAWNSDGAFPVKSHMKTFVGGCHGELDERKIV
jgi:hypothetical protein